MTSNKLKIIACLTMLIDHVGAVLYPNQIVFRIIGRIAFPIFAFLIVEGYFYTKDFKKYIKRLMIFALVSELPFDLAFFGGIGFEHQNVFFTLFLGLLALHYYDKYKESNEKFANVIVLLIGLVSILFFTDYNIYGIYMIFVFYLYRGNTSRIFLYIGLINGFMAISNWFSGIITLANSVQIFALLSFGFIALYNGEKGKKGIFIKYIFYLFYPIHLLTLYLIYNY